MNKVFNLNFLLTPILKIDKKWLLIYFFFYSVLIISCSFIYGYLLNLNLNLYDKNFNLIPKNIPFSNGDVIHNLKHFNEYFSEYLGIKFYLQKTPAIPLLIYIISLISENFFFILIVKNLIFYSIYFLISYWTIKSLNKSYLFFVIITIVPIIIPYNFTVSLNLVYEDCLIALILPSIFLLVISEFKHKYWALSILLFFLYFVKTSVFFIIIIIPLLIILFEKKSFQKYLPIFFSVMAILTWGFYGLIKTDRFPILSSSSSVNSHVMTFVLNDKFHKYYPDRSTDIIPINHDFPKNIKNEWELYDFFDKKNNEYLSKNLDRYLKDVFIKTKFIFFGIKRDNALPDKNGNFNNEIRISQIFSKIILNLSILLILGKFIINPKKFFYNKINIFFIFIVFLNLTPHLMVWASSKHLIGIINVSLIYLIFNINNLKNYLIKNNFL